MTPLSSHFTPIISVSWHLQVYNTAGVPPAAAPTSAPLIDEILDENDPRVLWRKRNAEVGATLGFLLVLVAPWAPCWSWYLLGPPGGPGTSLGFLLVMMR